MDFFVENNFFMGTAEANASTISTPVIEPRGVFSLNASNQLQATFWIVQDGVLVQSNLGTASYQVYDKDGIAIAGLTQSGISPDAGSLYKTTPVAAPLIYDLSHYTVKITIAYDTVNYLNVIGLTLGE